MTELVKAQEALGSAVGRLAGLLRSGIDPAAKVSGPWTVAEVAAHLSHGFGMIPMLANGSSGSFAPDLAAIGPFTMTLVAGESERDLNALADRIEAGCAQLMTDAAGATGTEEHPWVIEGTVAPLPLFFCHLLSESLVHGHDIAQATGRPWSIGPDEAAMSVLDFTVPVIRMIDPRALVVEEKAGRLRATYDIRLRGHDRVYFVFADGELAAEPPSESRKVDCHISADPVAFLLVLWGRQSQWSPIARGKMMAWGKKPWLGLRLRGYLRNP